jgi:1-acyl-sn-glycerol-3-phosphate acyltransferase
VSADPDLNDRPVQFEGSRAAQLLLRLCGWRVDFSGLPARQGVIVVYPHTSNWDFVLGLVVKWSLGLPVRFWAKDSLFRQPLFGRWMRAVGGVPINRSAPQGVVGDTVQQLREARRQDQLYWLALAPEGTRSYTEGWRSGFYRVAEEARVPLGLATIDYVRRCVTLESFIMLSGNRVLDMALIAEKMVHAHGLQPQNEAPVRLL